MDIQLLTACVKPTGLKKITAMLQMQPQKFRWSLHYPTKKSNCVFSVRRLELCRSSCLWHRKVIFH